MSLDVIVVGGSYAGLSAALQLARARRNIVVIDAGNRRNRFAEISHGFLTQDGTPAQAIADEARRQLLAYPTVQWVEDTATQASSTADTFTVTTGGKQQFTAPRLIIASGIVDHLPDIAGLSACWGKSVFHCPYCHGYELHEGTIGVIATSSASMHHGLILPDWGKLTFFINDAFEPSKEDLDRLQDKGVRVIRERIVGIAGDRQPAELALEDGRVLTFDGLFLTPRTHLASPLAEQLCCEIEESTAGFYIKTDASKETTVSGVFACGDAARPSGSVALAVGDGALAGIGTHLSLALE